MGTRANSSKIHSWVVSEGGVGEVVCTGSVLLAAACECVAIDSSCALGAGRQVV